MSEYPKFHRLNHSVFWGLIKHMITMEEIIKTYAGNIRRARQNKKVTQAVMADKIGITEKYWSDIETGRKPCSLDTLVSIANALDVEPYELLLPENKAVNYDTRRAKIVMKQLKDNFSEMVDTLGQFLEERE